MRKPKFVVYKRDGDFQIVEGYDVFKACRSAGLPVNQVDMYTDAKGPRHFWSEGKWVRGDNKDVEDAFDALAIYHPESPEQTVEVEVEAD